jgi:hypothetical protein
MIASFASDTVVESSFAIEPEVQMRVDEPFGFTSIPPKKDCYDIDCLFDEPVGHRGSANKQTCVPTDCPFDEPPMLGTPPPPPPPPVPSERTGEFGIVVDSRGADFLGNEVLINTYYASTIYPFLHSRMGHNGPIRQRFQRGDGNMVASISVGEYNNQCERLEEQLPAGYRAANFANDEVTQLTRIGLPETLPGPGIRCQQNPQDPEGETLDGYWSDPSWLALTSMRARISSEESTSEIILSISPWQEEWDVPARNTFDLRRLKTSRRYHRLREWDYPGDQHEDRLQNEESNTRSRASRSFVLPAPLRLEVWKHRLNSTARLSLKFLRERIIRRETELAQNRRSVPANDSDSGSVTDADSDDESTIVGTQFALCEF